MRALYLFPLTLAVILLANATPARASDMNNPLFGYTHIQPSPFTLHSGRLTLGSTVAIGITDFLQVSTNILYDVYKVFNVEAKVSLIDQPEWALGVFTDFQYYNLHDFSDSNPDGQIFSWSPGVVASYAILPTLAVFVSGSLNYTSVALDTDAVQSSGFIHGSTVGSDLSWEYSPSKKNRVGTVLSAGVTYDFTYRIFGVGLSHHWPGFHIGIHYYPGAAQYRVQPILSGGTTVDF